MRLAIVCSWLNQYGGAERVLEVLHDMYPEAPIYTSLYRPEALPTVYRTWDVRTTFLNRLPLGKRYPQIYLPLFPMAFESLDLRGYDVVLSLTSAFAHGVVTSAETRHICYCLTPTRFLWNYHGYIEREGVGRLARLALTPYLQGLRQWDQLAAGRVDEFVSISRTVQTRIRKFYGRESRIVYPPVNTQDALTLDQPEDYFLVVSRLVPYKRIDLAVRAFSQLGLPLRVIGDGRDRAALMAMAGPNVQFLGYISDDEKREQMARCRAFVFPGEEDFGIAPLEAMASGRPVIAYGAGGAVDTIAEGKTGIYFREPTVESLVDAIERFATYQFHSDEIQRHALQFDEARFRHNLEAIVSEAL